MEKKSSGHCNLDPSPTDTPVILMDSLQGHLAEDRLTAEWNAEILNAFGLLPPSHGSMNEKL